jgi:hypothetical protein
MFIYMMRKSELVWLMHMRITIILVKFLRRGEGLKMEREATTKVRFVKD